MAHMHFGPMRPTGGTWQALDPATGEVVASGPVLQGTAYIVRPGAGEVIDGDYQVVEPRLSIWTDDGTRLRALCEHPLGRLDAIDGEAVPLTPRALPPPRGNARRGWQG